MVYVRRNGELVEESKVEEIPKEIEEGDRIKFEYKLNKKEKVLEKKAMVDSIGKNMIGVRNVYIQPEDTKSRWVLIRGLVQIEKSGLRNRNHGKLLNIEKINY